MGPLDNRSSPARNSSMMRSRLRSPTRAAASSIASGSPSSSPHTSATACSWPSRTNDDSAEVARSDEQQHGRGGTDRRRGRGRLGHLERRHRQHALTGRGERQPARHQEGQRLGRAEQAAHEARAVRERLQVVEHDQRATLRSELGQGVAQVAAGGASQRQRHVDGQLGRRGGLGDLQVGDVGEGVLRCRRDQGRHPRLARSPDARQRHAAGRRARPSSSLTSATRWSRP